MRVNIFRDPDPSERQRLAAAGYFRWGFGHWIHEKRLGRVLTTDQALARSRRIKTWRGY